MSCSAHLEKNLVVLPARMDSQRFHGKLLQKLSDKQSVLEQSYQKAKELKDALVVIATDSEEIVNEGSRFGARVISTSPKHLSGTDRVFEAYQRIREERDNFDLIINWQADMPFLDARTVQACIDFAKQNKSFDIVTVGLRVEEGLTEQILKDPSAVKVVTSKSGRALYFSRAEIPFVRNSAVSVYKHLGLYIFRPEALENFVALPKSGLEEEEKLEQLRALESGLTIGVFRPEEFSEKETIDINTRSDFEAARNLS